MTDQSDDVVSVIRARPDDTSLRLVYADELEEQGQLERAELIRVQCMSEGHAPGSDERSALEHRAYELLLEHEDAWLGPWKDCLTSWKWRRGFIDEASLTVDAFDAHAERLFAEHTVRRIGIHDTDGEPLQERDIAAVVAHPSFTEVRYLDPDGFRSLHSCELATDHEAWLAALAGEARLSAFRGYSTLMWTFGGTIDEREHQIDSAALATFCRAPHLHRVEELDLGGLVVDGRADARAIDVLGEATFAPRLKRLAIEPASLPGASLYRLTGDPTFAGLEQLQCRLTSEDDPARRRALMASDTLVGLETAELTQADVGFFTSTPLAKRARRVFITTAYPERRFTEGEGGGWRQLLTEVRPPTELHLDCAADELFVGFVEALRGSPWVRGLTSLRVHDGSHLRGGLCVQRPTIELLLSGSVPHLAELHLSSFESELYLWLGEWDGLRRLAEIDIDNGQEACPAALLDVLCASRALRELHVLEVRSPDDVDRIQRIPSTLPLRWLGLRLLCDLDAGTLRRLFVAPVFSRIEVLSVGIGFDVDHRRLGVRFYSTLAQPDLFPRLRELHAQDFGNVCGSSYRPCASGLDRLPELEPDFLRRRFGLRVGNPSRQ